MRLMLQKLKLKQIPKHINPEYVRSRIALGAGKPFSQNQLEEQLRLLQIDPLFKKVEASIRPGTNRGQSIVIVKVTEAPAIAPKKSDQRGTSEILVVCFFEGGGKANHFFQ